MGANLFDDFDFSAFWEDSDYARAEYIGPPVTDEQVSQCESLLGFRLPASMVAFMQHQNGGIPARPNYRTSKPTSWADDHVAIAGLFSLGSDKPHSLAGSRGNAFWREEWGYPPLGVYFADCPSAGHDMLCLDYRECGTTGEPTVVHVNQEFDYEVTFVARDFETFVRGLEAEGAFVADRPPQAEVISVWIDPAFARPRKTDPESSK